MSDSTTTALADLFGVTTRIIRDLKKRGIIVAAGRDFALADSVRRYCKHLRNLASAESRSMLTNDYICSRFFLGPHVESVARDRSV